MTDSRLKGEWLGAIRFDELSDTAWRVFTSALMWSNEQGTDGKIPTRYLRYLHPDGLQPDAFEELESAGLWVATDDGYAMPGWGDKSQLGQSTAEQVRSYRENAAERQRKHRNSKATRADSEMGNVTENVTRDVTGDVGTGLGNYLKEGEPPPWCDEHVGGTNANCGPCGTRRQANGYWHRNKPTPVPPVAASGECVKHPGYPDTRIVPCAACKREREDAA